MEPKLRITLFPETEKMTEEKAKETAQFERILTSFKETLDQEAETLEDYVRRKAEFEEIKFSMAQELERQGRAIALPTYEPEQGLGALPDSVRAQLESSGFRIKSRESDYDPDDEDDESGTIDLYHEVQIERGYDRMALNEWGLESKGYHLLAETDEQTYVLKPTPLAEGVFPKKINQWDDDGAYNYDEDQYPSDE